MTCLSHPLVRRRLLAATLLPSLFALTGCGSVPLTSLWKMRALNLEELDPQAMRAALVLPPGLQVQADSARLDISVSREVRQGDGRLAQERLQEQLVLEPLSSSAELSALQGEARPRHTLKLWRIRPDELPRLRRLRQQALAWPPGSGRTLSLGIGFEGCRQRGGADTWPVTSLLRFSTDGDYIALLRDADLARLLPPQELARRFPVCPG